MKISKLALVFLVSATTDIGEARRQIRKADLRSQNPPGDQSKVYEYGKNVNEEISIALSTEENFNAFIDEWADRHKDRKVPSSKTMTSKQSENLIKAMKHVQELNSLNLTWYADINAFSHLNSSEIKKELGIVNLRPPTNRSEIDFVADSGKLHKRSITPLAIDWTNNEISGASTTNFITPIKNQGSCGACYAFASAAYYEAAIKILSKGDYSISVSEAYEMFLAYSQNDVSDYCNEGAQYDVFEGVYQYGVPMEQVYPFEGESTSGAGMTLESNWSPGVSTSVGPTNIVSSQSNFITYLQQAPLVSYFYVDENFYNYAGGIYVPPPSTSINHAVLLVGYNETQEYWKFKNSWGTYWGEMGFFRIVMSSTYTYGPASIFQYDTSVFSLSDIFLYDGIKSNVVVDKNYVETFTSVTSTVTKGALYTSTPIAQTKVSALSTSTPIAQTKVSALSTSTPIAQTKVSALSTSTPIAQTKVNALISSTLASSASKSEASATVATSITNKELLVTAETSKVPSATENSTKNFATISSTLSYHGPNNSSEYTSVIPSETFIPIILDDSESGSSENNHPALALWGLLALSFLSM